MEVVSIWVELIEDMELFAPWKQKGFHQSKVASWGLGKKTKNCPSSAEITCFSLLEQDGWNRPGCTLGSSLTVFVPSQSWNWGGLLHLLVLKGERNREKLAKLTVAL